MKTANLKLLFEKAKDYEKASFKGLYNFINYIDKISKSSGDAGAAKLIGENDNVIRIMSIHKSKGLEFPVVFLCGTGKNFNTMDLKQNVLLHQDMGFGPKFIDYERKIKYDTLAKEAIKVKSQNEMLSEEMRLLYVALTRAKEKLIITGCDKDMQKSILQKRNVAKENNKLDIVSIRKSKSYLDWLELVYLNNNLNDLLEVNLYNKNIEEDNETSEEEEKEDIWNKKIEESKIEKINNLLNWKYKYLDSTKIEGKASVTNITKGKKKELSEITKKPKFLNEKIEIGRAEIGTLMHLVMQKLDFSKEYNEEEINELIQGIIAKDIITENEAKYIDTKQIIEFTKSDLYKDVQNAKEVHKEKPFYIYLSSKEIYKNETDENILVQGIIDLYYINKEDKLILVDYKTDYVANNNEQELIDKYKEQLEIYKRALEQALNRKVEAVYIYSVYLGKNIHLN